MTENPYQPFISKSNIQIFNVYQTELKCAGLHRMNLHCGLMRKNFALN